MPLEGTTSIQPLIFTWAENPFVSGAHWSPGDTVTIHLIGPNNTLGATSTDTVLPGTFPPGPIVVDNAGNFKNVVDIPDHQRPGNYVLQAVGGGQFTNQIASIHINICPQTVPEGVIQWAKSRGGRDGQFGDRSPERTDPEWIATWSEQPVALSAIIPETVAMTSDQPANQPSFISHADLPYTHYAHDWNMELVPDADYLWVLGTANFNTTPGHANYGTLECEWETQNRGTPTLGSYGQGVIGLPLWATPSAGDQIYMVGRWNMDNGHPDTGDRTELHPVRMLAATRKRNIAIPFSPTGCMTRASQTDIFVSGHGGGANQFRDELSRQTDPDGMGGGRLEDVLSAGNLATYFAFGPASGLEADVLTKLLGGDIDKIKSVAGPTAFGWIQGPEQRAVNDMNYDFNVRLPPPPPGATQPRVRIITHPEHTTAVNEAITYTTPDLSSGLPTLAHIHLPYRAADNGIYARTLNFYWDKLSPPGRHFVIKMNSINFFLSAFLNQDANGHEFLWSDICGHWVFLTEIDPNGFLHVLDTQTGSLTNLPPFDVYVDPNQTVRVFVQGYDQEEFDAHFGVNLNKTTYQSAIDLAEEYINVQARTFGTRDGDNIDLGGAIFEGQPIPLNQLANGILGHHAVFGPFFYMDFNISYVPNPHLDVTDAPVDFGAVPIGSSQDRVIRVSNAAVGLNNNDPGTNAGVDTLNITSLSLSPGFSLVAPPLNHFAVDAGGYQDITVRFTPANLDQGTGTLTIQTNDACQPTRTVSLTGTVIAPRLAVSAPASLFEPTVIGCISSTTVTVSNAGTSDLIFNPRLLGDAYTLSPFFSSGDGIHLPPGTNTQLTVNFAPKAVARVIPGNLVLDSNDPVNSSDDTILCGEGTQTGIRVLVLQPNGVPYPTVDQIVLKGPTVNRTLQRLPLTVISNEGCAPIQFHFEAIIPPTDQKAPMMVEARKQPRPKPTTLTIKIGRKKKMFNLNIDNCDFTPIVVTM